MMGFIICTLHQILLVGVRNAYRSLVQQHAGKRIIRRHRCRKENYIKKDLNGRMWINIGLVRTGYRAKLLRPRSFYEFCKKRELSLSVEKPWDSQERYCSITFVGHLQKCHWTMVYYINPINTGLFISLSGISELDCATTKTDTAERSISIGRESLQVFFVLGAFAYFQLPPLGGSREEKWRSQ